MVAGIAGKIADVKQVCFIMVHSRDRSKADLRFL